MNLSIRNSVTLTLVLILLAQVMFSPWIFSLILVLMTLYFYYSQRKQDSHISKKWTYLLTVLALLSIFFSYKSFLGVDAGVATLTTFLFAKALETRNRRDLIILFNFALFVCASYFLYSQSMWMAVMVVLCLVSCLIGLYRIQTTEFIQLKKGAHTFHQDLKDILKFIGFAFPFFLLLFLFFPRLPPLWYIPVPDSKGVTGLSDRMSPGDIAELSQSSELAFRISGNIQELPPRHELYWRAMVLDEYDGMTWTSGFINQQPMRLIEQPTQSLLQYQYIPADPQQNWVMGLEKSLPATDRYQLKQDWSISPSGLRGATKSIPLIWIGTQGNNTASHEAANTMMLRTATAVPVAGDEQSRQFALKLFKQSGNDPEVYISNVLKWYQTQGFVYTLSPGRLGQNRVDEFLFKTKQGFCEHYASSFAMLLRYAGIPSRIVVGYQGGEAAPDLKSWEVRQMDAHAWTEVWLHGKWVRFDPTAIIAPQRIDQGMQNLISDQRQILGEGTAEWKYQQLQILRNIRIWSDYASYQWQSKVVGYDAAAQQNWLQRFGLHSSYSLAGILVTAVTLLALIYAAFIFIKSRVQLSSDDQQVQNLSNALSEPYQRLPAETVTQWLTRLAQEVVESDKAIFAEAASVYAENKFGDISIRKEKKFKILIKRCTYVLKSQEKACFKK
jgi:uncharacterized membrane protein YciS (DUF1049 family)